MIRLALNTVNRLQYSETFIKDHFDGLPYKEKHFLHGGYMPIYANGHLISSHPLIKQFPKLAFFAFKKINKRAIKDYFQSLNINVLLSEYGPCGVEMMDLAEECGIPHLVYFHGYDITRQDVLEQYSEKYKVLFQKASVMIAVSEIMKENMIKMGAPEEKLHLIPCGANQELFFPTDDPKKDYFLSVGRFAETKAPDITIKAFAQLVKKQPEARLKMAGKGPLLKQCKELVRKLEIQKQVEFLGVIPHEEVALRMRECLAFVQHSVTTNNGETEGTPVAVSEAGLSGTPVVSTYHAGIPDVVINKETGLLVNERDVDAMSKAMSRILEDKEEARQMGINGYNRVKENYTVQHTLDKLHAVIESQVK